MKPGVTVKFDAKSERLFKVAKTGFLSVPTGDKVKWRRRFDGGYDYETCPLCKVKSLQPQIRGSEYRCEACKKLLVNHGKDHDLATIYTINPLDELWR